MRINLLLLTLIVSLPLFADGDVKMYLEKRFSDEAELNEFDEAFQLGKQLKAAIAEISAAASLSPDRQATLKKLKNKLLVYEKQMYRTYGLIPGLQYVMVPESGSIFAISTQQPQLLKKLHSATEVRQFRQAISLQQQLLNRLKALDSAKNKKLFLEADQALKQLQARLHKVYGIGSGAKFQFKPQSGAIFVILNVEDLKNIGRGK